MFESYIDHEGSFFGLRVAEPAKTELPVRSKFERIENGLERLGSPEPVSRNISLVF
jgi:hypothetical protein